MGVALCEQFPAVGGCLLHSALLTLLRSSSVSLIPSHSILFEVATLFPSYTLGERARLISLPCSRDVLRILGAGLGAGLGAELLEANLP